MVIFHCYVSSPEGINYYSLIIIFNSLGERCLRRKSIWIPCGNVGNQTIYKETRRCWLLVLNHSNFEVPIPKFSDQHHAPVVVALPCHADTNRPSDPQVQWLGTLDTEAFQMCGRGKDTLVISLSSEMRLFSASKLAKIEAPSLAQISNVPLTTIINPSNLQNRICTSSSNPFSQGSIVVSRCF